MEGLRDILPAALHGKHTHVDPLKALEGLTPEIARKKPAESARSCWELLYHMEYWQDIVLKAYRDEDVSSASDKDSWPTSEQMENDEEWHRLVERFTNDLNNLVQASKEDNLQKTAKAWANTPLYFNIIVEIGHNSFHLGQIVATRRILGNWPFSK